MNVRKCNNPYNYTSIHESTERHEFTDRKAGQSLPSLDGG